MQLKHTKRFVQCVEADHMCQKWFTKFCAGDFSLDNALWLSRPVEVDSNQIETLCQAGDSRHVQNAQINSYW